MFHWSFESGSKVMALCGDTVMPVWCAKSHRGVTCDRCISKIHLLPVVCPVIIRRDGSHVRGCGQTFVLGKTKCTRSYLRLCPECNPELLCAVLDSAGNQVRMPPKGLMAGMSGEDDEARRGIKIKENS